MLGTDSEAKTVRAVERAADVLMCFAGDEPTLSVTDLERRLSLSRPTLYRLLHTLEGKGLVRSFGEPRRFELGHGAVKLGHAALARIDVARLGHRHLRELWRATGETVALFVPVSGGSKMCVEEIQSRQALVYTRGAGFNEPVTVGASGKAILAFMPAGEAEAVLAALTDDAERVDLRADLAEVRRTGYRVSTGEIMGGAVALAAPVFAAGGTVAGSICVFGPEARLTGSNRENCVRELCATADRISEAMGHRRSVPGALDAAE